MHQTSQTNRDICQQDASLGGSRVGPWCGLELRITGALPHPKNRLDNMSKPGATYSAEVERVVHAAVTSMAAFAALLAYPRVRHRFAACNTPPQ
jgi:hypothetical protein